MACLYPMRMTLNPKGFGRPVPVKASTIHNHGLIPFPIPCGKCLQCKLDQSRDKSTRSYLESTLYRHNMFITLTYSDDTLGSNTLVKEDLQNFLKRLRKKIGITGLNYMAVGEYGEKSGRMHWHILLFGYEFPDKKPAGKTKKGEMQYTSDTLSNLWTSGIANFGSVTSDSCSYVASYSLKKLRSYQESEKKPLFFSSKKNAIGKRWLEKNVESTFNNNYVMVGNVKTPLPIYFKKWLLKNNPQRYLKYVEEHQDLSLNEKYIKERTNIYELNSARWERGKKSLISKSAAKLETISARLKQFKTQI